jgi:hypothetical protein
MSAKQHNHRVTSVAIAVTLLLAGVATIVFGDVSIGLAAVAASIAVFVSAVLRMPHTHRMGS